MTEAAQRLLLRLELIEFLDAYVAILDNARLKEWPALFVEDCLYEIIPKENEDHGLPAPVMYCDNDQPPYGDPGKMLVQHGYGWWGGAGRTWAADRHRPAEYDHLRCWRLIAQR